MRYWCLMAAREASTLEVGVRISYDAQAQVFIYSVDNIYKRVNI